MPDTDFAHALSDQYRSRTELMVEILKIYFRILVLFAIGLLACIGALLPLKALDKETSEVIVRFAFQLGPYLILSWFAGYLFLFWNYRVVIGEMDCIADRLAKAVSHQGSTCLLSHQYFLNSYTGIGFLGIPRVKSVYLVYLVIASPIVLTYVLLSDYVVRNHVTPGWPLALYGAGLVVGPILCLTVHFMFGSRIGRKESRLKDGNASS